MEADIDRILFTSDRIADRVRELANAIAAEYGDDAEDGLTLVTILSGSLIFLADLMRQLPIRMKIGLITVSSYPGAATQSQGVSVLGRLNTDIRDRHVLIVDDILDTGNTLRAVSRELEQLGPRSLRTCVLLRKPSKAPKDVRADFVGFDVDDVFVVGYGLDYKDHYRNYPHIGVLRSDLYVT
jgi:hypoxanthine phosphoribosyltransferase